MLLRYAPSIYVNYTDSPALGIAIPLAFTGLLKSKISRWCISVFVQVGCLCVTLFCDVQLCDVVGSVQFAVFVHVHGVPDVAQNAYLLLDIKVSQLVWRVVKRAIKLD